MSEWGSPIDGKTMRELHLPPKTPVSYDKDIGTYDIWSYSCDHSLYYLHKNHPYYRVTDLGFSYWNGETKDAPADWDESKSVITRPGIIHKFSYMMTWLHEGYMGVNEIIGYHKLNNDERKTEIEWNNIIKSDNAINIIRDMGLIREDTLIDKFKRDYPNTTEQNLKFANHVLKWVENQK